MQFAVGRNTEACYFACMGNQKILVIEQDDSFYEVIVQAVQNLPVEVMRTSLPQEGFELVQKHKPDLVFVQVELPKSSGFSFCNKIKKAIDTRSTTVVLLAAETTEEALYQHKQSPTPADAYLKKPITQAAVLALIEKFLTITQPTLDATTKDATKPPPLKKSTHTQGSGAGSMRPLRDEWRGRTVYDGLFASTKESTTLLASGAGLEEKLDFYRDRLKRMESDFIRMREAWQIREREMTELETLFQNHKTRLHQAIDELCQVREQSSAQHKEQEVQVKEQTRLLAAATDKIKSLEDHVLALEQHQQSLAHALSLATQQADKERMEKDRIRAEYEKQTLIWNEEQSALREQISERVEVWGKERSALEEQVFDVQNQLQEKTQALEHTLDEISDLKAKVEERDAYHARACDELDMRHGQEITERDVRITELNADLQNAQAELVQKTEDTHQLTLSLQDTQSVLFHTQTALTNTEQQLKDSQVHAAQISEQLTQTRNTLKQTIDEKEYGFLERDEQLIKRQEEIYRLAQEVTNQQTDLSALRQIKDEQQARIEEQTQSFHLLTQEKEAGFALRDGNIAHLYAQLQEQKQIVTMRDTALGEQAQTIDGLRETLALAKEELAQRTTQNEALMSDMQTLHQKQQVFLEQAQARELSMTQEIDTLRQQINTLQDSYTQIRTRYQNFKEAHQKAKKALLQVKATLKEQPSLH